MDLAHLCIAVVPLAAHLLMLAMLNLSRRPHVVSGSRNIVSLALAVSGFVIAGPMDLLLPDDAVRRFGPMIWPMLICFYILCLTLVLLISRPYLIIYGMVLSELKPILEQVVTKIDSESRWAGESANLPQLRLQFHCDDVHSLKNVTLVPIGNQQSYVGWRRLQVELNTALRSQRVSRNLYGFVFLLVGIVLLAFPLTLAKLNAPAVVEQLRDLLRLSSLS